MREDITAAAAVLEHGLVRPGDAATIAGDWAGSGAMALTGESSGPPLHAAGWPASAASAAADAFEAITGVAVDGPALLGERAALTGLSRRGGVSCGGGTRLFRASDGWCALNLARDADLVPALVADEGVSAPWPAVCRWAARRPAAEVVERAVLLGMACARLGEVAPPDLPWRVATASASGPRRNRPLRVVNLGALWAGPLAAHLLGLAGADVVHVESTDRRDPVRTDAPAFYRLLRGTGRVEVVDFAEPDALRRLLGRADVVLEASRPRALGQLGLSWDALPAGDRPSVWVRITGHPDTRRIAFGDDAAVAGGLVGWTPERPVFAGDAIADPLTGLLAAVVTAALLTCGTAALVDLRLAEVAAYCSVPVARATAASRVDTPRVAARRPSTCFGDPP